MANPTPIPQAVGARVVEIDYESRKVLVRFAEAIPAWLEIGPVSLATPTGVAADERASAAPDLTELLGRLREAYEDVAKVSGSSLLAGEKSAQNAKQRKLVYDAACRALSALYCAVFDLEAMTASPSGERTSAPAPEGEKR